MSEISLVVNGKAVSGAVEPRTNLADFIRDTLNLTGTHLGCEHGVCGACTVLIDGVPARSCISYALSCGGAEVTTIEGLDEDEITRELRAAFTREHALQCGYCTPGMLVSARDLVVRLPNADEQQIRVAMSGNLCRCTGYVGIIRAVQMTIAERRARGIPPVQGGGRTALGPVGSGHAHAIERVATFHRERDTNSAAAPAGAQIGAPSLDPNWQPQASFEQNFVVHHPLAKVWEFFGQIEEVATCLPGASIKEASPQRATGQIRVKLGPIAAEFGGIAEIERDERTHSGRIQGAGSDARTSSSTRGDLRYTLVSLDAASTRVDVTIGYRLTGMLAQFGRAGLVQDLAARLTSAFAQNLEARLSGRTQSTQPQELSFGGLIGPMIVERARRLWASLLSWRK
ncbi:MAG: 2Fe-2S iron-sulfur cluster binding domain-containing protein [Methylobacteriaceae bacterium]|nr:2Fe-2S iron-sulfur cluster binding domain-containing protein [Methylobacteriaceae bacterium]